jgi:hypothetical protein
MRLLTDLLITQTIEANSWVNKLTEGVALDKWFITPEILETSFGWQIGHLTLSQYYYGIVLLKGPDKEFAQQLNMSKYSQLFAKGLKKNELVHAVTVTELIDKWEAVTDKAIGVMRELNDEELIQEIHKMPKPHPFVKTRQDSISWNIKHTMWHCGQMGILKRVIDQPIEFGM